MRAQARPPALLALAPSALVLADARPPHSLHRLLIRWCWQMLAPPHSLHRLLRRWCWMPAPCSLHLLLWRRVDQLINDIREYRSPIGLVVGSCTSHPGVWGSFPNERNQGKQAHPVLKYRVPQGSHIQTGLGSSSLIAHVLHSPPPPREQLCNRSCSNKTHVYGHGVHVYALYITQWKRNGVKCVKPDI